MTKAEVQRLHGTKHRVSINMPDDLYSWFKHRAIDERVSLNDLAISAMRFYMDAVDAEKEARAFD